MRLIIAVVIIGSIIWLYHYVRMAVYVDTAAPFLERLPKGELAQEEVTNLLANPRVKAFVQMYGRLTPESVETHIDNLYADTLYFNDTFHTFEDRTALRHYFTSLADGATVVVEPIAAMEKGDELWLQWTMRMQVEVAGKPFDMTSVGISQLRFNEQNQIVLHQDFWDGVGGFYGNLPLVGSMIGQVRKGLGAH